jgi:hypothetical protein
MQNSQSIMANPVVLKLGYIVVAFVLLLPSSACIGQRAETLQLQSSAAAGLWLLKGMQIEEALIGRELSLSDGTLKTSVGPEYFSERGSYLLYSEGRRAQGRYFIRKDDFCVQAGEPQPVCRQLYIDDQGNYYLKYEGTQKVLPIIIK